MGPQEITETQEEQETQAITIRLPKDMYQRLRRAGYEEHTSQADIVRQALAEHFENVIQVGDDSLLITELLENGGMHIEIPERRTRIEFSSSQVSAILATITPGGGR